MSDSIEIKICGQTNPDEAAACVNAGANAIGIIFHRLSPRYVTPSKAKDIVRALPSGFPVAGVFADAPLSDILRAVDEAGIRIVQLHGQEPDALATALLARGYGVVRVLKTTGPTLKMKAALIPRACGILVECGKGPLPGGNAAAWNWADAHPLSEIRPYALAGGLSPDTVMRAIVAAHPSAVDVSSGVEDTPGRKNLEKTRQFIENARRIRINWPVAPIFGATDAKGTSSCPHSR